MAYFRSEGDEHFRLELPGSLVGLRRVTPLVEIISGRKWTRFSCHIRLISSSSRTHPLISVFLAVGVVSVEAAALVVLVQEEEGAEGQEE
jgi:hypothetical protein